jgi:preprotein translocase subunit YajC
MRQQQDVQQSIEVGHEVVTTSGIFGTITGEDGPNRFWLEIDDEHDVQIRVARAAIQNVVTPDDNVEVADRSDDADSGTATTAGDSDDGDALDAVTNDDTSS